MSDLGSSYDVRDVGVSTPLTLEAVTADATVAFGSTYGRALKRTFDVVVASALLLVLSPIVLLLVVLVRLDSPGPAFFRCERVGFRGRPLHMLKFRKMVCGASGLPLTKAADERFTRIGRLLAKFKLDELPQLWHVVVGEMSLIGPRPEAREFVERHADAFYGSILCVRPGIVGLSQIAFANESAVLEPADPVRHYLERILPQKLALDVMYARRLSLRQDLTIFFWALVTVALRRPVAVNRDTGAMHLRHRARAPKANHGI